MRGYYVYKDIWDASSASYWLIVRGNLEIEMVAMHPVAITKEDVTVGHIPRAILLIYKERRNNKKCVIAGRRRYLS